jgi:2-haloacid dehalogenase
MGANVRYDWVLLDADGTLFDYERAEADALERALMEVGVPFSAEHLAGYRSINASLWSAFECGRISRDALRLERFEEFSASFSLTLDPSEFSGRYLAHLACGAALLEGASELLSALDGRVGMVLLTNGFAEVQRSRIAAAGVGNHFAAIVISEEVGAAKPAPEIFDVAFARMGHPDRGRVLMVGDGLESDIRGGNGYGIDTCWFNPSGSVIPDDPRPRYVIRRLAELHEVIEADASQEAHAAG